MNPDSELLRRYAKEGNETAFAEVVRRHTDLVYSAALRIVRDAALAQDVTQSVFTKLARMAGALGGYPTPIGWLHTTTRHTAINAVRAEGRRRAREHEAFTMQSISSTPDANWEQLRPILDEAVGRLRERDRQAVLLRFFNGLSFQEVGAVLGLTEDSAQKCVDRALKKLRARFARRGVTVSSALLATAMSANSVQAAPVGLAAEVAKASTLSVGSGASLGSALLIAFYMSTKIKTIAAVIIIAVIMGGFWWFNRSTVAVPEKIVPVSAQAQASAPKLVTPVAQVEPPMLSAMTPSSTNATPASADPQTDLKTAIAEIASLYRSNDLATFWEKYTPPDQLTAALNDYQENQQEKADSDKKLYETIEYPESQRMIQLMQIEQQEWQEAAAKSWAALEAQTPVYNAAGDEATYVFEIPVSASAIQANGINWHPQTEQMVFIKINGKWYLKGEEAE